MTYSSSIEFLNFNNWLGWPGHHPGGLFNPKTLKHDYDRKKWEFQNIYIYYN